MTNNHKINPCTLNDFLISLIVLYKNFDINRFFEFWRKKHDISYFLDERFAWSTNSFVVYVSTSRGLNSGAVDIKT